MKNLLLYNYNIDIDNIKKEQDNIYSFYIDYNKLYLINYKGIKEDVEEINYILSQFVNPYHYIIKNKNGNIFTQDEDSNYILLKIKEPENSEINMIDIINNQIPYNLKNLKLHRNNWGYLWSEKIDYLEYQVSELSIPHPTIVKSFSYYIGLAENAIEYYNNLNLNNSKLYLCQKRIEIPNISKKYYNPLSIIIDYRVRDIAEYIKSSFYNEINTLNELNIIINKNILNNEEANLLYARLLYPSYYFDDLNKVLEKNESDDILIKYMEKAEDYELFLKKVYNILDKKYKIIKIDWIINK